MQQKTCNQRMAGWNIIALLEGCPSELLEEVESAKEFPEDARMVATS